MRYLSLFSGIEAASVAWHPIGLECVGVSEIEQFANAVLVHHYPSVPNLGNVLELRDRLVAGEDVAHLISNPPDIIVGGSPCQSFSVAGSRNSLNDHRGNLTLVYAEIIHAIRPEIIVWENVPGVLSTKDNAFGHLLGALAGEDGPLEPSGKKWTHAGIVSGPERNIAWRILDAQYFGVPQRRRRIFVIGCSTASGRDPAEILFECKSLQGYSEKSGKAGKDSTRTTSAGAKGGGGQPSGLQYSIEHGTGKPVRMTTETVYAIQGAATRENLSSGPDGVGVRENVAYTLEARSEVQCVAYDGDKRYTAADRAASLRTGCGESPRNFVVLPERIAGTMKSCGGKTGGWSNSVDHAAAGYMLPVISGQTGLEDVLEQENGTHTIAFDAKASVAGAGAVCGTMRSCGHTAQSHANSGWHLAVAHTLRGECFDASEDGTGRGTPLVATQLPTWAVRRLTPIECARLQGFPDNYLNITYRNKPAADGNKYRALGNSMAVPVMAWIGRRILNTA